MARYKMNFYDNLLNEDSCIEMNAKTFRDAADKWQEAGYDMVLGRLKTVEYIKPNCIERLWNKLTSSFKCKS
jgi:hypothetical protein